MRTDTPSSSAPAGAVLRFLLSTLTLLSGAAVVGTSLRAPGAAPEIRGVRHAVSSPLFRAAQLHERSASASSNWAGYAVTGSDFRDVVGTWQVPPVRPGDAGHRRTFSAIWVGLDGDNSRTVEQCGTEQDYVNGQAQYSAWMEIFPSAFNVTLDPSAYPVEPGDFINAEVKYEGNDSFLLSLTSSRGWTAAVTQPVPGARRSSAEWIMEAPSGFRGALPLADFGHAALSGCKAAMGSQTLSPIGNWTGDNRDQITMASRTGTKAQASELTEPDKFSVLWQSYH